MSDKIHSPGDNVADRYVVEEFIGEGGMQEVYRAHDSLLSRKVALKAPKNSSAVKRFRRSALVSARVNHANVAKTLDYVETSKRAYLIEELIDGYDLRKLLTKHVSYFDPYLVAWFTHHLSRGLAASHHAGVFHRDIKPGNIIVVGGVRFLDVKITDFGIAKMAGEEIDAAVEGGEESMSASATAVGALPYMAPEAFDTEPYGKPDKPADIWSLGALIYELCTGVKPFGSGYKAIPKIQAASPPSMQKQLAAKPQFAPLAKSIETVVMKCLSKDPTKRPTADQIVNECEAMCYSVAKREFGVVKRHDNPSWGFISPVDAHAKDIFFHVESIYGDDSVKVGDAMLFSRHDGGGADRAFPLIKAKSLP